MISLLFSGITVYIVNSDCDLRNFWLFIGILVLVSIRRVTSVNFRNPICNSRATFVNFCDSLCDFLNSHKLYFVIQRCLIQLIKLFSLTEGIQDKQTNIAIKNVEN